MKMNEVFGPAFRARLLTKQFIFIGTICYEWVCQKAVGCTISLCKWHTATGAGEPHFQIRRYITRTNELPINRSTVLRSALSLPE